MYLARKYLLGTLYFTSPTGDRAAILRGHPSHTKVEPLALQREYLHFSVILRPWVLVRSRESNPRPPALQSVCSLVHNSYSLPEWQAVKLNFFAPCRSSLSAPRYNEREKDSIPVEARPSKTSLLPTTTTTAADVTAVMFIDRNKSVSFFKQIMRKNFLLFCQPDMAALLGGGKLTIQTTHCKIKEPSLNENVSGEKLYLY